ncbi:MAG: RNA-binding protein [Gammaproteobacteria bacterium]|nr:RNA-binding protein [Gammaproteobacteria bacterium]
MTTSIYVGNLDPSTTSDEIRALFAEFGEVESVDLLTDRQTGQPRGFGFVKMADSGARAAIAALNARSVGGRNLKISEARPKHIGGASRARGGAFGSGGGRGPRHF